MAALEVAVVPVVVEVAPGLEEAADAADFSAAIAVWNSLSIVSCSFE